MRRLPVLMLAVCGLLFSLAPLRAGDAESEMDDHENGAPFFGATKDVAGLRPLGAVRVKVQPKGRWPIFINSNEDGMFKLGGLGKTIDPETVDVACDKKGYRTLEVLRRRTSRADDAAVEIECLLEREK